MFDKPSSPCFRIGAALSISRCDEPEECHDVTHKVGRRASLAIDRLISSQRQNRLLLVILEPWVTLQGLWIFIHLSTELRVDLEQVMISRLSSRVAKGDCDPNDFELWRC